MVSAWLQACEMLAWVRRHLKKLRRKNTADAYGQRGLELISTMFLAFFLNTAKCSYGQLVCRISKSISRFPSNIRQRHYGVTLQSSPLFHSPHRLQWNFFSRLQCFEDYDLPGPQLLLLSSLLLLRDNLVGDYSSPEPSLSRTTEPSLLLSDLVSSIIDSFLTHFEGDSSLSSLESGSSSLWLRWWSSGSSQMELISGPQGEVDWTREPGLLSMFWEGALKTVFFFVKERIWLLGGVRLFCCRRMGLSWVLCSSSSVCAMRQVTVKMAFLVKLSLLRGLRQRCTFLSHCASTFMTVLMQGRYLTWLLSSWNSSFLRFQNFWIGFLLERLTMSSVQRGLPQKILMSSASCRYLSLSYWYRCCTSLTRSSRFSTSSSIRSWSSRKYSQWYFSGRTRRPGSSSLRKQRWSSSRLSTVLWRKSCQLSPHRQYRVRVSWSRSGVKLSATSMTSSQVTWGLLILSLNLPPEFKSRISSQYSCSVFPITLLTNLLFSPVGSTGARSAVGQLIFMSTDEKGFLKKYPKVEPGSHEWKLVEFKLQLSLGTSAVVVKKIYDISSTHLSSAFSSNAKGSIILESFLPTDQLNEGNKLFKVCQKGYEFSEDGMIFNVGFYRIRDTKKEISCVMNKISVGKSYCYGKNKFINEPIGCPEGFESIYLYNEEENPQVFRHQYVVFKNHQVLPVYVIDYVVDTEKEQQSKAPLCENCNKIPPENAKWYCVTENAHFCAECNEEYHLPKLANKHHRVEISDKPKKFGHCEKHENVELELYCSTCSEALCVNCKIFGNHMSGEMARHSLIKLKDAYSEISSKVKEIDPNIERRKNQLTDDLSKIDLKIKEINAKATHIEEQLYAIFQKALKELQNETEKKLSFLICDQLELKRQYDHILWMDSFIKHQLQIQEPHEFLNSWNKFSRYKKEVLSLGSLSINTEVKADMKLEGEIKITVEGKSKQGNQGGQNSERIAALMNEYSTPQKEAGKSTADKDLGSTQLRKTIFKKHYSQKIKDMGQQEPYTVKGSMSTLNKINEDYKQ